MRRVAMAVALAAAMALCGCGGAATGETWEREDVGERFVSDWGHDHFRTVVDSKTGVTYLVFWEGYDDSSIGGITPLLDSDGTPVIAERVAAGSRREATGGDGS